MKALLLAALLTFAAVPCTRATFALPGPVPVDRIIKNTEAKLEKTPEDIGLRYQLARTHYLAFSVKRSSLRAGFKDPESVTAEEVKNKRFQYLDEKEFPPIDAETAREHAKKAMQLFAQVLQKEPRHALAHLGLGSLLEELNRESEKAEERKTLHDHRIIRGHYLAAFEEAWKSDEKNGFPEQEMMVPPLSYEAAQAYVRVAKIDAATLTPEEKKQVEVMEEAIKKMDANPRPVSPLVFSFQPAKSINALLAPERHVRFDLRGFGAAERWPWVQPETAILVWDPANEGRITSGRQMFGSDSWQLFWKTGFDALAALDDSQDGWLRGSELDGLSVWRDRNQDAVSDAGEVTPLSNLGVTGLACTALDQEGIHPRHRQGVEMKDGGRLPLWDWIASPLRNEPLAAH